MNEAFPPNAAARLLAPRSHEIRTWPCRREAYSSALSRRDIFGCGHRFYDDDSCRARSILFCARERGDWNSRRHGRSDLYSLFSIVEPAAVYRNASVFYHFPCAANRPGACLSVSDSSRARIGPVGMRKHVSPSAAAAFYQTLLHGSPRPTVPCGRLVCCCALMLRTELFGGWA